MDIIVTIERLISVEQECIRKEIVSEYYDELPLCAVFDIETILIRPAPMRFHHPVNLESLSDGSFVQVCPSLGSTALWVRASNNKYRAAFSTYAERYHGVDPTLFTPAVQIDHLYALGRAAVFNHNYLRVTVLPRSVNGSHGGGYDKMRGRGHIRGTARDHPMDSVILAKAFGIPSPFAASYRNEGVQQRVAEVAAMLNISTKEYEAELSELRNNIARFKPD